MITLLLTATIDPGGTRNLARADPELRAADYQWALGRWCEDAVFGRLIFCENSGAPLDSLNLALERLRARGVLVETSSFNATSDTVSLGKGAGEMEILAHVFRNFRFPDNELVVKMTGRIFARNLGRLVESLSPDTFICCDFRRKLRVASSQLFAGRPRFFTEYLLPQANVIDERAGLWFEHALARAVHRAMADGLSWEMLPVTPVFEGIAATDNRRYPDAGPAFWKRQLLHELTRRLT